MTKSVEVYFTEGCGRCSLMSTPQCKVHQWAKELQLLRNILNNCGLIETCKWGVPVYTYNHKNVIILSAFKTNCVISFLKGAGLQDTSKILVKPGENSNYARVMRFTNIDEILSLEETIQQYIFEAIEIEKSGIKLDIPIIEHPIPEELINVFDIYNEVADAFYQLTPGKQKSYLIHFNQAKQSETRIKRIDNCIPHILNGIGYNDIYKLKKNNS